MQGPAAGIDCRITLPTLLNDPALADSNPLRPFIVAVDPKTPPDGLKGAIVAIGNFDGIHRGHKAVILRAREIAAARRASCALLTFEPHPSDYFGGLGTIFRLTPQDEKARLVARLGLDGMIVLTFDGSLANLPAEGFVSDILVGRLGVGGVVAGYDFHFGKMRGGTPAFLKEAGQTHGFTVEIVERIEADAEGEIAAASSTATRAALELGNVSRAAHLLGHPFAMTGTVIAGEKLGRTLGFPTANLTADPSCRLRHGIYAVRAEVDGVVHDGVASWGRRPTVTPDGPPLLEVFLFDFSGDLYGKAMEVSFYAWLRAEERFDSLDALKAQMLKDAVAAKQALSTLS